MRFLGLLAEVVGAVRRLEGLWELDPDAARQSGEVDGPATHRLTRPPLYLDTVHLEGDARRRAVDAHHDELPRLGITVADPVREGVGVAVGLDPLKLRQRFAVGSQEVHPNLVGRDFELLLPIVRASIMEDDAGVVPDHLDRDRRVCGCGVRRAGADQRSEGEENEHLDGGREGALASHHLHLRKTKKGS